jgi:hypothetical protein
MLSQGQWLPKTLTKQSVMPNGWQPRRAPLEMPSAIPAGCP